jgi:sortase A
MRRTIAGVGRTLVTLGLLILLFVAYQLWGTGIFTARAQERLKNEFNSEQLKYNPVVGPTTTTRPGKGPKGTTPTTRVIIPPPAILAAPAEGQVEGHIVIPKIGVDWYFVEGVQLEDIAKGPGHYPLTPLPGQLGNSAIAGHRTTHGAPFFRVNELVPGDKILITTHKGLFTYAVTGQQVVQPTDFSVVQTTDPTVATLTLTSCNPRYSAAQRIVIHAKLVPNESAKPTKAAPPPPLKKLKNGKTETLDQSLAGDLQGHTRPVTPTVLFGIVWAVIALAWWWLFRRWRHPVSWIVGLLPFMLALFVFYYYLERALPPGI